MWRRVAKRIIGRKSTPPAGPSPRDVDRVDKILSRISEETFLVFDLLKDGMVKEASFKTMEENITRRGILSTFEQVRADAYGDAAAIAREHAKRFSQAALSMPEPMQRQFALSVAAAFERFAKQLQAVERQLAEANPDISGSANDSQP